MAVCVALWAVAVAGGAPVWSSHPAAGIERDLARNATAIAAGQWWRVITYWFVNLGVETLVFVMASGHRRQPQPPDQVVHSQ